MVSVSDASESMDASQPTHFSSDSEDDVGLSDPAPNVPTNLVANFLRTGEKRPARKVQRLHNVRDRNARPSPTPSKPITSLSTNSQQSLPPSPPIPTSHIPRVRQYLEGSRNEWVVFFRPKCKALNTVRIASDLMKHYSGVNEIRKLNKNKLRVSVNNAEQANQIVCDQRFVLEYRVWIPAHIVEIDGVVTEESLTTHDLSRAVGFFKKTNLPSVKVIDVRQMGTAKGDGVNRKFTPSSSFRITFAGSALPDYIVLDNKLRLPVRMYIPRVMSCDNCKQLGHTKAYCGNKSKCSKCGENHTEEQCHKVAEKCLLCGGPLHDTRACPKYKERSDKMKRSLKERSKRSFAEILASTPSVARNENCYSILSDEETDSQQETEHTEEEIVFSSNGATKRKKSSNRSQGKTPKVSAKGSVAESQQPGPSWHSYEQEFPTLTQKQTPRTSEPKSEKFVPPKAVTPPEEETNDFKLPFSTIVEWILSVVTGPEREFLEKVIPFVRKLGKQLASKSTLLSFISFDV